MKPLAVLALLFFCVAPDISSAKSGTKQLMKGLESADVAERSRAQSELRTYRFKDVVRLVADFGDGANPDVRILMAQVLGEIGGAESAKHLQKLFFKEKVERVRRAILVQLTGLIPTEFESFNFYNRVIQKDSSADIRGLAASQMALLGKLRDYNKEVVEVLKRTAKKDSDATNRAFAALLAAEINEDRFEGLKLISDSLSHADPAIRRKAVEVIEEFDDPVYAPQIQNLAETDPDPQVRAQAAKALISLKQ